MAASKKPTTSKKPATKKGAAEKDSKKPAWMDKFKKK
jgi:hypothetical protein